MTVASRTPEGEPNLCPLCGGLVRIEPARPPGDAPCPHCGCLLWFLDTTSGVRIHDATVAEVVLDRLRLLFGDRIGIDPADLSRSPSFLKEMGVDSLDLVELMMELEEEFGVNISDTEAESVKTPNDILDVIVRRLREKQGGAS